MARQTRTDAEFYGLLKRFRGAVLLDVADYGRTPTGDAAYTILLSDRYVAQNVTLTASRTKTLPAANTFPPGIPLVVADETGSVTTANTLIIARAGSDTIDGATSVTLDSAYGYAVLMSDGSAKWTVLASSVGTNLLAVAAGTTPSSSTLVFGIQGGAIVTFTMAQVNAA